MNLRLEKGHFAVNSGSDGLVADRTGRSTRCDNGDRANGLVVVMHGLPRWAMDDGAFSRLSIVRFEVRYAIVAHNNSLAVKRVRGCDCRRVGELVVIRLRASTDAVISG